MKYSRREFLKAGAAGALAASVTAACGDQATTSPQEPVLPGSDGKDVSTDAYGPQPIVGHSKGIPLRTLGKTGRTVTILGLGGAHQAVARKNTGEAVKAIHRALDLGITYLDTARNYSRGRSERNYGEALRGIPRDSYYLNTKTNRFDYDGAMEDVEMSLKALKIDYVDCIMLHGLGSLASVQQAFAKDGAIHALTKARKEGKTKLIGFSGHSNSESLEAAMEQFDFDVALMSINPADYREQPFEKGCYRKACQKGLGVVNMKTLGGHGQMIKGDDRPKDGPFDLAELLGYTWSLRGHAAIVGFNSIDQIAPAVDAAKAFQPISREKKAEMERRSASIRRAACLNFRGPYA